MFRRSGQKQAKCMLAGVRTCVLARWRRRRPESSSYRTGSRARWIGQGLLHSAMHVLCECELRSDRGQFATFLGLLDSGHYRKRWPSAVCRLPCAFVHESSTMMAEKIDAKATQRAIASDRSANNDGWLARNEEQIMPAPLHHAVNCACASSSLMCRSSVGSPLLSSPLGGNKGITSASCVARDHHGPELTYI